MSRLPLEVIPVSLNMAWRDPAANLKRIEATLKAGLRGIRRTDERLFVFPELTLTGFVTQLPAEVALDAGSPILARLKDLGRRYKTAFVAGYPEKNPDQALRPFNAAVLIGPEGTVLAKYRKVHRFTLGNPSEADVYAAGAKGTLATYRGWKIALAICFDLRFPALFNAYAKKGADLIVVPSCWVDGPAKNLQFRTLAASHAITSQAFVVAVNRKGHDAIFRYDGKSYVFSPEGLELKGDERRLDPERLERARSLAVRPSELSSYPVQ